LPSIQSAAHDAQSVASLLTSDICAFPSNQVFVLTNAKARHSVVRSIIAESLSQSKPEDLVCIFFMGHGVMKDDRFYLLLYDSDRTFLPHTAIALDQLADLLATYVPANKILLVLDAHRSEEAKGGSWQTHLAWSAPLQNKELSILYAAAPYEISKERAGSGLFMHVFKKALAGASYLNQTVDANGDGMVNVDELGEYLRQIMRFSGLNQHPVFWGHNAGILALWNPQKPWIQICQPQYLHPTEPTITCQLKGKIRHCREIQEMSIESQMVTFQPSGNPLPPWNAQVYEFTCSVSIPALASSLKAKIKDDLGKWVEIPIPLIWQEQGWYDE